jgi:DNA repair ATPase RecN
MQKENKNIDVENSRLILENLNLINSNSQLCMVLVGEGGTGKSRIINAIDALCLSWDHTHCLIKAAPTGKAAVLINGRTLASVLIRLRNSSRTDNCLISCIIIDEMSMMTLTDLYELDKNLRDITGLKTLFGGISIILCGDFLQLPPAGGKPLYKIPQKEWMIKFIFMCMI